MGRDLPDVEKQYYWRSFNKLISGVLSYVKFQRDFEVNFTNATDQPFVFINTYNSFNAAWEKKFKWPFYTELKHGDEYNLTSLHIPDARSLPEFDALVLSLNKLVCDGINEKEIVKKLKTTDDIKGSLNKLECWLKESGKTGYEAHVKFLRNLQELRSSGTGHKKGDNYLRICRKMYIETDKYDVGFRNLLNKAIGVMKYLENEFLK